MNLFFLFAITLCNALCASSAQVLWEQVTTNAEYGDKNTRFVLDPIHLSHYDAVLDGKNGLAVDNPAYTEAVAHSQPRVIDGSYVFRNNSEAKIMYTDGLGDCVGIAVYFSGSDDVPGFSGIYHCTQFELFAPGRKELSDTFESDFLAELTKRVGEADKNAVKIYLAATYLTNSVTEIVSRLSRAGFNIASTSFPKIAFDRTSPSDQNVYMLERPITSVSYDSIIRNLTTGIAINSATGEVFVSRIFRKS